MANLTEAERQEIVRDIALDLVGHMSVTEPPVWVENLLKNPPSVCSNQLCLVNTLADVLDALYVWSKGGSGEILVPKEMPLVERRFALANELFNTMTTTLIERVKGLAKLLVPELGDYASYFARIFLAPDHLVNEYRKQGNPLHHFADTFLIPNRIAIERWHDPIYLDQNPVEPFDSLGFSPS